VCLIPFVSSLLRGARRHPRAAMGTAASRFGGSRGRLLALLGDSTIDNGRWVAQGEPSVTDQVSALEPCVMCARDGAMIAAIAGQLPTAPAEATHFVVSVGGNDATGATTTVLGGQVNSAEEALCRLHTFAQAFEVEFAAAMQHVVRSIGDRHLVICSCYNPCFAPFDVQTVQQGPANLAMALLADAVLRVATRLRVPVIDLRRVMTEVEDFANPIEPSSRGGLKIAQAIVEVVRHHDFTAGTAVYPRDYPESELVRLAMPSAQQLANKGSSAAKRCCHPEVCCYRFIWRTLATLYSFDTCQQETGGSCHLFGCEDWRNAQCVQGKCMCRPDECVVMGECLPQSRADVEGAPAAASRGNFTALVLSGGGAKGAFELGVLEGICKNESLRHLRNWSMIVGTSIGALNAGALAQFPPHLQCTQRPAMTTKTGATELKEVPPGPPLPLALAGAVIQLSVMHYVWSTTSAGECLHAPLSCLLHPFQADAWGRTVIFVDLLALSTWAYSLHSVPHTGTSDPSIVDRLWSIMPWLYTWHWFLSSCWSGQANGRLLLMALLATMWGVRLTYNFYIKGGFSGGEDYRWAVVRRWYPGWQWEVFNLVFICCFQQVAVMAFTVPAVAALQSTAPLQVADLLSAALFVALFIGETVADKQMFEFQTEKYRRKAAGEPLKEYTDGFIQSGLWAYSRHPNYFCEVSMWWVFYLFSIPASGKVFNWTIWGAIFLSGLFVIPGASLDITEALSTSKYPEYAKYQQRVSKFFPLPSASASARAPQLATAKAQPLLAEA
ncbi:unnamed protein product, partial [Effrenium voratum]